MKPADDPFLPSNAEAEAVLDFEVLARRPMAPACGVMSPALAAGHGDGHITTPLVATFEGFDVQDQPLVRGVPHFPGEKLPARSIVALRVAQVGQPVVLMFENGDPRRPIVMGVLAARRDEPPAKVASVLADGERQVIEAEREIVLRCGDASITLTRAGKVIIKGRYVLSRSSGINKIKGAAVDIN